MNINFMRMVGDSVRKHKYLSSIFSAKERIVSVFIRKKKVPKHYSVQLVTSNIPECGPAVFIKMIWKKIGTEEINFE